jgi:hypothetical protein
VAFIYNQVGFTRMRSRISSGPSSWISEWQVAERNLQIAYFHTGYFEKLVANCASASRPIRMMPMRATVWRAPTTTVCDHAAAIDEWRKAADVKQDFTTRFRLAKAEQQRGNLERSLIEVGHALLLESRNARAHLLRGELLYQTATRSKRVTALEGRRFSSMKASRKRNHLLAFIYGELGDGKKAEIAGGARVRAGIPRCRKQKPTSRWTGYNGRALPGAGG